MNLDDLLTQLLYTAVPVWAEKRSGERTLSTGFIATVPTDPASREVIPFVVLNRHAVEDAARVIVEFFERDDDRPVQRKIRVEVGGDTSELTDVTTDIVAIPVAAVFAQMEAVKRFAFFRSISPELIPTNDTLKRFSAIEELVTFGFSDSIVTSSDALPLARRGISATPIWKDIDDRPAFLLDATVLPGFAGGPVFHYTKDDAWSVAPARAYFIGAIWGARVLAQESAGVAVVTKSGAIFDFLRKIAARYAESGRRLTSR